MSEEMSGARQPGRRLSLLLILGCLLSLLLMPGALPQVHAAASSGPFAPSGEGRGQSVNQSVNQDRGGLLERARTWILLKQRALHRELSIGLERVRSNPSASTIGGLILISFLYGVFHAAGPGHGKAVIATYLFTHRTQLRRGLLLSTLASLVQGVTAITLVFGVVTIAGRLTRDAVNYVSLLEQASFMLIALLGVWLALRALVRLWRWRRPLGTPLHTGPEPAAMLPVQQSGGGLGLAHRQRHDHSHGCDCGASHHVDPAAVSKTESRWTQMAAVMSIGARPCAGAVIVLSVAHLLNLRLAGLFAVLAMSVGTALTVCSLATVAVYGRHWLERLGSGRSGWLLIVGHGMALLGGVGLCLLGMMLFIAASASPATAPLFMAPRD